MKDEANKRVLSRLSEAMVPYVRKDNFEKSEGVDVNKLKKICKEENANFNDFCYHMAKINSEKAQDGSN